MERAQRANRAGSCGERSGRAARDSMCNPLKFYETMALNVQMVLSENKLINEKMVTPRLVNQQVLDYDAFCDYLAQGSTVTAADVSAVMKQLEKTIPLILALNAKITASPEGLTFRPTVRGSREDRRRAGHHRQRLGDERPHRLHRDRPAQEVGHPLPAVRDLQACDEADRRGGRYAHRA